MATVELQVAPLAARFALRIDGAAVQVVEGKGKKTVGGGADHVLQYYVIGNPTTKYTVAITAPPEAKGTWSATLDARRQDANQVWFWVD